MSKIARYSSPNKQQNASKTAVTSKILPSSSGKQNAPKNVHVTNSSHNEHSSKVSPDNPTSTSSSLSSKKTSGITAVRNGARRMYVEREFPSRSSSQTTQQQSSSPTSGSTLSPKAFKPARSVTSRCKTPSKLTTFGKNVSRESSPGSPDTHIPSGGIRSQGSNYGAARRSATTHHQSLQKRNSFESETQSSSDYYEDVKILSIRNQLRPKHHLLNKSRYASSMETSSDAQSESDIYDDVGIPGLRQNAYQFHRPKLYSPLDMSCESQSESDSHNYEEITEAVRNVGIPHNYEEIDEFSSDDDYDDYDDFCLDRSIGIVTPDLDDVDCCEPAEQQQIYTDWANHYLEKSRYKRCITDLQVDICDGVLLADIVHAVTNQKVPEIVTKPKNTTQMIGNINSCLTFLASVGVAVDGLNSTDIREGNLKAILGLFFSLSRYKQQQKQSHAGQLTEGTQSSPQLTNTDVNANSTHHSTDMLSRLPFSKNSKSISANDRTQVTGGASASNINRVGRGTGLDSSRSQLVAPGSKIGSRDSSRSASPSTSLSGIPTPGSRAAAAAAKGQEVKSRGTLSSSNITTPSQRAQSVRSASTSEVNKNNSMLDKFKFFKDKGDKAKGGAGKGVSKSGVASKASKDAEKGRASQQGSAASRLANAETPVTMVSNQGSPKLPPKGLKKSLGKSKIDGPLSPSQAHDPSIGYSQKATGSASSIPSRTSSTTSINSSVGGSLGRKTILGSKDASNSATRIGTGDKYGTKPKTSSSSYSSMPAPGTGIPKPGAGKSSKPSKDLEVKTKASSSGSGRKAGVGQGKIQGHVSKPPPNHPPPPTPQPSVPSSLPAPSMIPHDYNKVAKNDASGNISSTPVLHHSQSKHPPPPPVPQSDERGLKSSSTNNVACPDNVYTSVAPPKQASLPQKAHQPVQRSASVGSQGKPPHPPSPRQTHSNLPTGGSLYSASYACISPSKSQFPTIPEEPPPKPKKVDCDTQTTVSAVASAKQIQNNLVSASMPHLRLATAQNLQVKKSRSRSTKSHSKSSSSTQSAATGIKQAESATSSMPPIMEQTPVASTVVAPPQQPPTTTNTSINHSDSNMSTASESNVSSSSSKSNSGNNSASSTDSVIYRPSSCDELESGRESDTGGPKSPLIKPRPSLPSSLPAATSQPLDHISSLRRKQQELQQKQQQQMPKKETTFTAETKTEERSHNIVTDNRKESTEDGDSGDMEIKPMQPIMRSTPYSFLRSGTSSPSHYRQCDGAPPSSTPTSRMGNNRPLIDPTKLYTSAMRRCTPQGSSLHEGDYSSDVDGFDVTAGYMSDGDILRSNQSEEMNSGYMSEGGASLYAKRLQQRFREGMMAVKECMQKSAAMVDDDSFEDSSSISSGDISDTINDISTDEISTGSSLTGTSSERTNPYGSLKRAPTSQDAQALFSRSLPSRTTSYLANNKGSFEAGGINWKKYAIGGDNGPGPRPHGYQSAIAAVRKSSQAIVTDLRSRSGTAIAIDDPSSLDGDKGNKVNSETNTDRSVIMIRRQQGGQVIPFAVRRPSAPTAGERLSNYRGMVFPQRQLNGKPLTPGGAIYMNVTHSQTDMGPEAYNASTLERKKKALAQSQGSMGEGQCPHQNGAQDFSSNTLGRKKTGENIKEKLFGSRSSLNKMSTTSGSDTNNYSSTIISNPHATFGKHKHHNGGLSSVDTSPTGSTASAPGKNAYVPVYMTNSDYSPQRPLSAMSSPVNAPSWMRSNHGMVANGMRGAFSETESMENIHSSIHTQIQQAKALAEASRQIIAQNHQYTQSLQRSDSFKSTRSERAYPVSTSQPNTLPRTGSYTQLSPNGGPSSPTHSHRSSSSAFAYPMGSLPTSGVTGLKATSPYTTLMIQSKLSSSKDDDLHGSSLSLVSSSSSVYSTAEDKYSHEIRKLRRELDAAQEKVATLTTQLSTNAHVVSAFEQSLSNMTTRLQQLTSTAEQKDNELSEMKTTIDALRQQTGTFKIDGHTGIRRQSSSASTMSRDHISPGESCGMRRQMSAESMTSINSMSSACSATSHNSSVNDDKKGKKKKGSSNWLRSSFSKAFSRGKKVGKNGSMSDVEPEAGSLRADSMPNSPLLQMPHQALSMPTTPIKSPNYSGQICDSEDVHNLQEQLHEKDRKLTDVQLEALSSAAQLDTMRDTMSRMKNEMASLKEDNERLNKILQTTGVISTSVPTTPCTNTESLDKRLSLGDPTKLDSIYLAPGGSPDREGRKITVSVFLSSNNEVCLPHSRSAELLISSIAVSGKTKWEMLDSTIRRVFKEYCLRIDPVTNLGLASDSVLSYHIGDQITRGKDIAAPELLPCGYLVGDLTNITISLKGTQYNCIDALAFETLIPKTIVQRYVSLLVEHRRIILCGPSGTGKTYLAQKLAEYLVIRSGKDLNLGAIATFNVDHKSSKELRQYLANIAEQCEHSASELPSVIILDNLHHVGSLGEVFNGFLTVKVQQCPYIIGTMNQATCSTTNLQLHHNFRWVLCANHMEPVKGFLGRYLRRKLVEEEVRSGTRIPELSKIVDWIPKVWQHLNKFLETHSSSEVTVGPRLFLACPMDVEGAQVWFTDLWNYSIVPYLLEAVREGISLYGRRAPWEDPSDWILHTYPWPKSTTDRDWPNLLHMRPEDVGYDSAGPAAGTTTTTKAIQGPPSDVEGDPLMNMLMRLQEAASYSSPQSAESDSQSIDSHSSTSGANMESTL